MKKIFLFTLALSLALLLLTSCDILGKFIPGLAPETPDEPKTEVFDSSKLSFPDRIFTYDGNARGITVAGTLPEGVTVEYEGNNCTNVGTYTVTAKFYQNGEYVEGADRTATLTIKPATYDMSTVIFSSKVFTYTGETFTPVMEGELPEGVSYEITYDGPIVNAGTYEIIARFTGDSNHNLIPPMKITYTVKKAQYDMSGVTFSDRNYEYDADWYYSVIIEGTLPEGVKVEYKNNVHKDIGEYVAEAIFTSSDPNYADPAPMYATLLITPEVMRPVEIVYELTEAGTYEVAGWVGDNPHVIIPAAYKNKRVTSIKSGAFEGNTNITYLSIPTTVTNIGNNAFKGCSSLDEVSIRGSIEVIGYKAFAGTAIKELVLPDTLVSIGQGALMGAPIEKLTLPFIGGSKKSSNDYLGYLFGATSYAGNAATVPTTLKTVVLSDAAEKIPAFAFFGIASLEEVTVGKNVTYIGNNAFFGTSLKSIYIPKSVISVPADASAENSPFFGLSEDTVIMLESTAGAGYGRYWNAVSDSKKAITVYMKTYEYYLENKDSIKEADMSISTLAGITIGYDVLGGFASDVLEYTVDIDVNAGYPFVGAAADSPTALLTVVQASSLNGGVATVTVVSADGTSTTVYKVRFNVTGTFNTTAEVVGKDGTDGTVTFVVDDGDHATAEFTATMMEKYADLKFTYAILVNKLATLKTVYDPELGKYVYVMDEDGNYTYTVNQTEVEFWNHLIDNYGTEVISHTYTHQFWGNDDNGGVQYYIDSNGNLKTSKNLTVGSATAEIYASIQILEDLLGIRAITHTVPGIGVKTDDTTVGDTIYKTYYTYYRQLLDEALASGAIVNLIGNTKGVSTNNITEYVTKDNIKDPAGVARLFVRPDDNKSAWTQFIDNAAANDGWATFCIHKITPQATSGHYILESDAEMLFAHAASKNVWIANYTEAALYYAEWASAKVTSTYEDGKISVTLTDSEDNTVYDEELTVKVYVPATWSSASVNGEELTVHTEDGASFVYVNVLPDSGTVEIVA
jgi:hypothetical protein